MAKFAGVLIGGILLGVVAMLVVDVTGSRDSRGGIEPKRSGDSPIATAAELFPSAPAEDADELVSIEKLMSLPTEFERATALHILAARSDASTLQNLIFETNEIVNEFERANSLGVLFSRLTEVDARTALTLSRSDDFAGIKVVEQSVWRAWARKDFEDALFEAKTQTSLLHQKSAAQHLYAAFGYMGNATTDRIEAELGIGPDRRTRGRYLYELADRSIADAIDFINGVDDSAERNDYASWLAYYVSLGDPKDALAYAGRFSDAQASDYYESVISRNIAKEDPHTTIERLQASGQTSRSNGEYRSAVSALAKVDLDAARQYFEQARSTDERRMFGSAIATEMAKDDPAGAIVWARENDNGRFPYILMSVLGQVAQKDPQLALAEASKIRNIQTRSNMVSNVVQQVAYQDPVTAASLLDQIADPMERREAGQHLASAWIRKDPDAAIDWIMAQDDNEESGMVQMAMSRLLNSSVDSAIQLLPRLAEKDQRIARQQIAHQLATNGSAVDAQSFIQQFENEPGYEQLQASLITGVAQTDVLMAKQLADQLTAGDTRDRAYVQIISQRAQDDPAEAARWLGRIDNKLLLGSATGQIAAQWAQRDPVAAERWVSTLPSGRSRDDAILQMSYQWKEPTASQDSLIASIEDKEKRGQAKIRRVYSLMNTDIEKAREVLQDADISEAQRQQVELMLSQFSLRY